jgi:hypothetical protein
MFESDAGMTGADRAALFVMTWLFLLAAGGL